MALILIAATLVASTLLVRAVAKVNRKHGSSREDVFFGIAFGAGVGIAFGTIFGSCAALIPGMIIFGLVCGALFVLFAASAVEGPLGMIVTTTFGLLYGPLVTITIWPTHNFCGLGYGLAAGLGLAILGFLIGWRKK